jgi:predicted nucleic acid-binding protein
VIRTYLDAGTLINGVRGDPQIAQAVYDLIRDPEREFVASVFLRLEVLPKAVYHRRVGEVAYYERFLAQVVAWAAPIDRITVLAEDEARRHGMSALDSLHVAAATLLNAELVTSERPNKPIHRTTSVKVVAL